MDEARDQARPGADAGSPRLRIIDAAYRTLAERGYEATSIKEIARAAGVAPGLIHYYFASKEALLAEVLEDLSRRYAREVRGLIDGAAGGGSGGDARAAALAEPRRRAAQQPDWYRLRYEFFALGLRNPALRQGVAALLASGRAGIAEAVGRAAPERAGNADAWAALLLACFDGLALQALADPDFDFDGPYRLLADLLEAPMP